MQEIIPAVIEIIHQYGYIIVFFGVIVAGEMVILAASFLASLGYFNILLVGLVSLSGVMLADSLWYLLGWRYQGFIKKYGRQICPAKHKETLDNLKDKFHGHYEKILILGKFLYGIRIFTIVTCGSQKIPYKRFVFYNFLGNMLWLIVVISVGYLMGFSWGRLEEYNSFFKYFVVIVVLIFFVIRFILKKFINFNSNDESGN